MTATHPDRAGAVMTVTDEELDVLRETLNPDLTPAELRLFALVAKRSGLDPFARQIYAIKRRGRVTFQTSIDGYRSIAARTGQYDGQDEPEFGPPCACADSPPKHPEWATVRVYRSGMQRGTAGTAYWHEYKPASGPSGQQDGMWMRMPRGMLGKVAEALALRKAFPWVMSDVYTADEMDQADAPPAPPAPRALSARERLAARRMALAPHDTLSGSPEAASIDADDAVPRGRTLHREAFLLLVAAAEVERGAIAKAASELFPGVASRHYTAAHFGALAERLGLPRDEDQAPVQGGPPAPASTSTSHD